MFYVLPNKKHFNVIKLLEALKKHRGPIEVRNVSYKNEQTFFRAGELREVVVSNIFTFSYFV